MNKQATDRLIIKSPFKSRPAAFWIGLGTAALAIVSAVMLIALDHGDKTFSATAFVCMLVGGITFAAVVFFDIELAAVVPGLLYVIGFAFELDATLPPLSDVWNGVNFIGGNATMGLTFTVIFAVCALIAVVTCFMEQGRKAQNK